MTDPVTDPMTSSAYTVTITRQPLAALFDIRGPRTAISRLGKGIGAPALPKSPNTATHKDGVTIMWIGEARFLVHAPVDREADLEETFAAAEGVESAVLVSDAYLRFHIEGPDAAQVIAQATPLDIRPPEFPQGAATFTEVFAQTGLLHNAPEFDGYALWVERSYGDYIEAWLNTAAGR